MISKVFEYYIVHFFISEEVDKKIFEIEDMKNNPSYEGMVKKITPSGTFELGKITAICKEEISGNNFLVGDCDGKISLLDLGRKNLTGRVDINAGSALDLSNKFYRGTKLYLN